MRFFYVRLRTRQWTRLRVLSTPYAYVRKKKRSTGKQPLRYVVRRCAALCDVTLCVLTYISLWDVTLRCETLRYVVSCDVTLCDVTLRCVMWRYVVWCYATLWDVTLRDVTCTLRCEKLRYVVRRYATLCDVTFSTRFFIKETENVFPVQWPAIVFALKHFFTFK